jgi:hypothetical protein
MHTPYPGQPGSTAPSGGAYYGPRPDEVRVWPRGVSGGVPLASWPWRLAAGAIDYLPVMFIYLLPASAHALVTLAWVLVLGWVGFNSVYMQGMTSQSLGKRLVGIRLATGVTQPGGRQVLVVPGPGLCAGRLVAHLLDVLFFFPFCIGLLRPLWQREYKTFADSVCHTLVTSRTWPGELERREPGAIRAPGY